MSERNSTIRAREIGQQLRRFREAAGYSQKGAGQKIGVSTPTVCRMEEGIRISHPTDVAALLAVYGVVGPVRDSLVAIAEEAAERGWWQRRDLEYGRKLNTLASLEARACTITCFESGLIPGLLQAPAYAEALMRSARTVSLSEEEIRHRVRARMARRQVLFKDEPLHLLAFIDQAVFDRVPVNPAVMHRQLDYLLHLAEQPNLMIRVVPTSASVQVAAMRAFHLLRFPEAPAVVQTEDWASSLYYEEPADIEHYDHAVHVLMDAALDTGESVGLIARLMRTLEDDPDVLPDLARPPLEEE